MNTYKVIVWCCTHRGMYKHDSSSTTEVVHVQAKNEYEASKTATRMFESSRTTVRTCATKV